jgi:hypothetical protein
VIVPSPRVILRGAKGHFPETLHQELLAQVQAINHARWDVSLLRILWRQFSRFSFTFYVQENLEAHRVGSMPVRYRLV